jgi:hypothetical protein
VRVRWRDGKAFESNTLNVAVESDFYETVDASGHKSSQVEGALAEIHSAAAAAFAAIDRTGIPPEEGSPGRNAIATFFAFQFTRTTAHRERVLFPERVANWAGEREVTVDLVAEYLERVHLGFRPRPREAEGAHLFITTALADGVPPRGFEIEMMLRMVPMLVPTVLSRNLDP